MHLLTIWVHDLDPFLIRFGETFGIRWYGVAYLAGFFVGAWLLNRYYKRGISLINPKQQSDLFLAIILGVLVGGRLGYFAFYDRATLLSNPLAIIDITSGGISGMASHGGFLGVIAAGWICSRRFKAPFWHIGDLLASIAPPGLMLGRVANFINGELWGKPTDGTWGVVFGSADSLARHPSQLYAAALEGFAMLVYIQLRIWRSPVLRQHPGQLGGEFLLGYSIMRIIGEVFREPDWHIGADLGFINRGALLSIFMGLAGLAIILYARKNSRPLPR